MRILKGLRIWPPPRWPWIHKAKKILQEQGREEFNKWSETLTETEREELSAELIDLLAQASGLSREEVALALLNGKIEL